MAAGQQLGMHRIDGGAILEVEGEVGAGRLVVGAEQGDAVAGERRLQVGPVGRIPGELQAKGRVEGLGPFHVAHPERHVAKAMDSGRGHGGVDH
jgi:hypothetical protein